MITETNMRHWKGYKNYLNFKKFYTPNHKINGENLCIVYGKRITRYSIAVAFARERVRECVWPDRVYIRMTYAYVQRHKIYTILQYIYFTTIHLSCGLPTAVFSKLILYFGYAGRRKNVSGTNAIAFFFFFIDLLLGMYQMCCYD